MTATVTTALIHAANSGTGPENKRANAGGSHDGNNDSNTRSDAACREYGSCRWIADKDNTVSMTSENSDFVEGEEELIVGGFE